VQTRVLEALGPLAAGAAATGDEVRLVCPVLDAAALARLDALARSLPDAAVRIAVAPMAEIFRRVIAEATT
jgi:hypothetical protein